MNIKLAGGENKSQLDTVYWVGGVEEGGKARPLESSTA